MKYFEVFEEKFIALCEKSSMVESESSSDIVSMFTTKNTTACIHLDYSVTVLKNLSSTSNTMDTPMSEKYFNSLIARFVDESFLSFTGFTGNKQNENDENDNLQKRNPKGCLLYTSPSPRDQRGSRMPSSA